MGKDLVILQEKEKILVTHATGRRAQVSTTITADIAADIDPENIFVSIDTLNEKFPLGKNGLMYVRTLCLFPTIIIDTVRSKTEAVVSYDCPKDEQIRLLKHFSFRGKTKQVILVPISFEEYRMFLKYLRGEHNFQLFVFDEKSGWKYEENTEAPLIKYEE